ncbi:MAG: hypothetical protein IJH57_04505 [Mogibacterium sp.]|nr:hypothetical protein [Mogibacterium sp.]
MTSNATVGRIKGINKPDYKAPAEVNLDAVRRKRIANDRKRLIRVAAIVLLGIFVLVGMRAYCAYMQHANNELIKENSYLQAEIDSLNSDLSKEYKVTKVEEVAVDKYGMVFPTAENTINLGNANDEDNSLAQAIRSEAYN